MEERETYIQPIHQSSVDMCLRCKRSFMLRYRWCIFPKRPAFSEATTLGRIVHRLLQLGPEDEGKQTARAEIHLRIARCLEHIDKGEDLLGQFAREANKLDELYNKALAMAKILWEKHPRPANLKSLAKEQTIKTLLRLNSPDDPNEIVTEIEGTLDEILEDEKTNLIWIRDYKTSGRDVAFTMTGYQHGLQCRLYRLLAGAYLQDADGDKYKGRSPEGFILEVLQAPKISLSSADRDYSGVSHTFKSGPRKGQTEMRKVYEGDPKFENYLERCKEWYVERGDEAVQSFSIRFNEPVLPIELRADLIIAAVYRLLPAVPENFPRDETTSYCKYYERVCPYYDLCSRDEASWDAVIADKFEVVPPKAEESDERKTDS